jgi:hypothetical protein
MTCSSPLRVYGRQADTEVSQAMESAGVRDPRVNGISPGLYVENADN